LKTNNSDLMDKICAETLALIAAFGIKGWTVDTLCQKSGISKDTFYRIIKNKEELIKTVLLKEFDTHMHKMTELMGREEKYFDALKEMVALVSKLFAKIPPARLKGVFLEYPSLEKAINEKMEDYFANMEDFLNRGKRLKLIKKNVDPGFVIKIIHVCIMEFVKQPEKFNINKDIEVLLNYLIEGIKA